MLRPGRDLDASQTWPALCTQKCIKTRLRPCIGLDASQTWPDIVSQKLPGNAEKLGCDLEMSCSSCPKNYQEILENMVTSLPRPGRIPDMAPTNCLEMPENMAASLPWPRHVPDMACALWAKNYLEMPQNQATHTVRLRVPENRPASLLGPGRVLDMACKSCPKNCVEMPGNQAVSLSRRGRISDMADTPHLETTQKCLKIRLRPCRSLRAFSDMAYTPCPRNA
ncbi:Hypothetical predicted protein [Olea europaea subsp. europaea]|uniref:Uncharacterized protein n=1 Tax=Olea europaea subsp. europaea TaxID=158383 RepID=A0A8S0PL34_OLEEU|nr:Hypothetical predicted protein [Olea europaea subsp. europaea]